MFAAPVTFGCSGLPDPTVSCSFVPAQIGVGAGPTTVTVTVTTSGPNVPGGNMRRRASEKRGPWLPLGLPLVGMVMVGLAGRRRSRGWAVASFCVALALAGVLVACGGGSSSAPPPPPPVMVSVGPAVPTSLYPNNAADGWPTQTAQFTATVSNSTNTAVTWSVTTANGGTIDGNGLYTAPTVAAGFPASVTVRATSQADPTKFGSGQETLNPTTIPGTYSNIMVTATESTTVNGVPVTLTVQ